MDFVGLPGKGLNISLNIRTRRRPNKKQKTRTDITDIVPKYLMKLIEEFKDLLYLGYRKKRVKSEPTEAYFLLVPQLINNKKHIILRN